MPNQHKLIIAASLVFCAAIIALQILLFGDDYLWWISYEPVSPLPWDAMSTFTYLTIGSVLYHAGFYLGLYRIMRAIGFRYRDFELVKEIIWIALMVAAYHAQLAAVLAFNSVYSAYWNAIRFIVFLLPSLGVLSLVLVILYFTFNRRRGHIAS